MAGHLRNLAMFYLQWGHSVEAEPLLKRALLILEQTEGPQHPIAAAVYQNFAEFYARQERYAEAEQELGLDPLTVATILSDLALLCLLQGREAEGSAFSQRALDIRAQAIGLDLTDPLALFKHAREQGGAASSDALKSRRRTVD